MRSMEFNGARADTKPRRDFLVRLAADEMFEYLALARRQILQASVRCSIGPNAA
jgi:hypothetical protein